MPLHPPSSFFAEGNAIKERRRRTNEGRREKARSTRGVNIDRRWIIRERYSQSSSCWWGDLPFCCLSLCNHGSTDPACLRGPALVFCSSSSRVADLVSSDGYCRAIGGPLSGDDPRGVVVGSRGYVPVPRNSQRRPERALREFRGQRANDWWYSRGLHLYRGLALSFSLFRSLSHPPRYSLSHPLPSPCSPRSAWSSWESKSGSALSGGRHVSTTTVADGRTHSSSARPPACPPAHPRVRILAPYSFTSPPSPPRSPPKRYEIIERKRAEERGWISFVQNWNEKSRLRDRDVIVAATRGRTCFRYKRLVNNIPQKYKRIFIIVAWRATATEYTVATGFLRMRFYVYIDSPRLAFLFSSYNNKK